MGLLRWFGSVIGEAIKSVLTFALIGLIVLLFMQYFLGIPVIDTLKLFM